MPDFFEFPDSPFLTAKVLNFNNGDGLLIRKKLDYTVSPDDDYHVVIDNEELGDIALRFYGTSKYWWVIADVNDIDHPLILETGSTLLVPKLINITDDEFQQSRL